MANIKVAYQEKIKPLIQKELGLENVMQVPRLDKIVLNMGLGEAIQDSKLIEAGVEQLRTISGQMPVVTRAKKAISNFKLREGVPIGVRVTLRGKRMYEFYERLVGFSLFLAYAISRDCPRNHSTVAATILWVSRSS